MSTHLYKTRLLHKIKILTIITCTIGLAGCVHTFVLDVGAPAGAEFIFEKHEVITDSAKRQTVLTGFLLGGDVARIHRYKPQELQRRSKKCPQRRRRTPPSSQSATGYSVRGRSCECGPDRITAGPRRRCRSRHQPRRTQRPPLLQRSEHVAAAGATADSSTPL